MDSAKPTTPSEHVYHLGGRVLLAFSKELGKGTYLGAKPSLLKNTTALLEAIRTHNTDPATLHPTVLAWVNEYLQHQDGIIGDTYDWTCRWINPAHLDKPTTDVYGYKRSRTKVYGFLPAPDGTLPRPLPDDAADEAEGAKEEAAKEEAAKVDAAKVEAAKVEAAKRDSEAAKREAEAAKREAEEAKLAEQAKLEELAEKNAAAASAALRASAIAQQAKAAEEAKQREADALEKKLAIELLAAKAREEAAVSEEGLEDRMDQDGVDGENEGKNEDGAKREDGGVAGPGGDGGDDEEDRTTPKPQNPAELSAKAAGKKKALDDPDASGSDSDDDDDAKTKSQKTGKDEPTVPASDDEEGKEENPAPNATRGRRPKTTFSLPTACDECTKTRKGGCELNVKNLRHGPACQECNRLKRGCSYGKTITPLSLGLWSQYVIAFWRAQGLGKPTDRDIAWSATYPSSKYRGQKPPADFEVPLGPKAISTAGKSAAGSTAKSSAGPSSPGTKKKPTAKKRPRGGSDASSVPPTKKKALESDAASSAAAPSTSGSSTVTSDGGDPWSGLYNMVLSRLEQVEASQVSIEAAQKALMKQIDDVSDLRDDMGNRFAALDLKLGDRDGKIDAKLEKISDVLDLLSKRG